MMIRVCFIFVYKYLEEIKRVLFKFQCTSLEVVTCFRNMSSTEMHRKKCWKILKNWLKIVAMHSNTFQSILSNIFSMHFSRWRWFSRSCNMLKPCFVKNWEVLLCIATLFSQFFPILNIIYLCISVDGDDFRKEYDVSPTSIISR